MTRHSKILCRHWIRWINHLWLCRTRDGYLPNPTLEFTKAFPMPITDFPSFCGIFQWSSAPIVFLFILYRPCRGIFQLFPILIWEFSPCSGHDFPAFSCSHWGFFSKRIRKISTYNFKLLKDFFRTWLPRFCKMQNDLIWWRMYFVTFNTDLRGLNFNKC